MPIFPINLSFVSIRSAYKAVSVVEEACQQPALLDGRVQKKYTSEEKEKREAEKRVL
jgi:hypothetical protein